MKKLIAVILLCKIIAAASNSAKNILDFLKQQDAAFPLDNPGKVVLMLGNTGTGKTTTTILLTTDTVMAIKEGNGSLYHIYDPNGKIGNITGESRTNIPEAYFDTKLNLTYYDCPGFKDSRSAEYDISIGYLVHKLLKRAESFKIVLVVNHSSVKKSGTPSIFPNFVKTIVKLFKNIDTYKEGIAMIAVKPVKSFIKVNGKHVSVKDSAYVVQVAVYLKELKKSTKNIILQNNLSQDEIDENVEKIKLIDILLEKNNKTINAYDRIGILRAASKAGPLANNTVIQKEVRNIKKIITKNLQYVGQNKSAEFGLIVSTESQVYVKDLIKQVINTDLLDRVSSICKEIKQHYHKMFEQKQDFLEFNSTLYDCHRVVSDISSGEPLLFTNDLINRTFGMINGSLVNSTLENIKYIEFLLKTKQRNLPTPLVFTKQIDEVNKYVKSQFDANVDKWVRNLLKVTMSSVMGSIKIEINEFYSNIEEINTDIYELHHQLSLAYGNLSEVDIAQPQLLLNAINKLGINISEKNIIALSDLTLKMGYVPEIVTKNQNMMKLSEHIFQETLQVLEKTISWYEYMITLDSNLPLASLATSENATEVIRTLIKACDTAESVNDFSFDQLHAFLPIKVNSLPDLNNVLLNSKKKNTLKTILSTFVQKPTISCLHTSNMTVTGKVIRISQITSDQTCFPTAQSIEIFASIAVFIDDSITKNGTNVCMAIMSPVWNIIEKQSIILRGLDGKSKADAKDSTEVSSTKHDGEAGYPGGAGGNFLGIGEVFLDGRNLTILSEGGKGGPGQNGGKGIKGTDGSMPRYDLQLVPDVKNCFYKWPSHVKCLESYLSKNGYKYQWDKDGFDLSVWRRGSYGTSGGHGGNGGVGGFGGRAGHIKMIELDKKSHYNGVTRNGDSGFGGKGAPGGERAVKSYIRRIDFSWKFQVLVHEFRPFRRDLRIEEWTPAGTFGLESSSAKNRIIPGRTNDYVHPSETIQKFKNHLMSSLKGDYRESITRRFIVEKLEKNVAVIKLSSKD